MSFSNTSNSTRPSNSCYLRSLKNSLVHVISNCTRKHAITYTVLLRNNLTENAFGTRPKRVLKCVPFAFHLRSICVPFAFHLRSICVPFAFQMRSICVPLLLERTCVPRSCYPRIETGQRRKSSLFPEY